MGPIEVTSSDIGTSDAISWSFNVGRSVSPVTPGGPPRQSSDPAFSEVTIERLTDEQSPLYIRALLGGTLIDSVVLTRDTMVITLENCLISEYDIVGEAYVEIRNRLRRSRVPQIERITINFNKVAVEVDGDEAEYDLRLGL